METLKRILPDKYETLAIFILIIILTLIIEWFSRRAITRFIRINSRGINSDPTNYKFLANALRSIIYSIGFIFAVREYPPLQAVAGSLLAGAGIFAVAVGFASQQAFSNIISGIFIVIFKPFRVNDRLKVKDNYTGIVEDITLRHTIIRDIENNRIVIPNSVIATEIIVNSDYSDGKICKFVELSVSFSTDIDMVKRIITEEIERHPYYIDPRTKEEKANGKPIVDVHLVRFTDFAMVFRAAAWAHNNATAVTMSFELLESIKKRFDAVGIEIPFPHYVIVKKT